MRRLLLILACFFLCVIPLLADNKRLAKDGLLKKMRNTDYIMEEILEGKSYRGVIEAEEKQMFSFQVVRDKEFGMPDIMLILDTNNQRGNADIYCDSISSLDFDEWISTHDEERDYIFISRNSTRYADAMTDKNEASFSCYIFGASIQPTTYTLTMEVDYEPRILVNAEQLAMKQIYDQCCSDPGSCTYWNELDKYTMHNITGDGEDADEIVFFDFCHMPMSICDSDGHLIRLGMPSLGLSCEFPYKPLSQLTKIQKILLSGNSITGDIQNISKSLSDLEDLELLDLSDNILTGALSAESLEDNYLCTMLSKNMSSLLLGNNKIKGPIPECILESPNLAVLVLKNNPLDSEIPDKFQNSSIEYLNMDNAQISGNFPRSLGSLKPLRYLSLVDNRIEGTLPDDLGSSPTLEYIYLNLNHLKGPVPDALGDSAFVIDLNLSDNGFVEMPKAWIKGMHNDSAIKKIEMENNLLNGPFPLGLAQTNIKYAGFSNNTLSGYLPHVSDLFPKAYSIIFRENNFNGSLPAEWSSLGLFKGFYPYIYHYNVLDLSYNHLSGEIPEFFTSKQVPLNLIIQESIRLDGNKFDCINVTKSVALSGVNVCGELKTRPRLSIVNGNYEITDISDLKEAYISESQSKQYNNSNAYLNLMDVVSASDKERMIVFSGQDESNEEMGNWEEINSNEDSDRGGINIWFAVFISVLMGTFFVVCAIFVVLFLKIKNKKLLMDIEFGERHKGQHYNNNSDLDKLTSGLDSSKTVD